MWSRLFLISILLTAPSLVTAQDTALNWRQEFIERRAEWGGDIRYASLELPNGQRLQVGCVRNRIERVLIRFPSDGGVSPVLPDNPRVTYAFDGDAPAPAQWKVFERGTLEVPRGGESSRVTKRIAQSQRLVVRSEALGGAIVVADFDLAGSDSMILPMLAACEIK